MTAMPNRLPTGGQINRARRVAFRFDGRSYAGFAGDTLASGLMANGVSLFGRSFKYHRPRGILSAGVEEPNALVEIGIGALREPNTKATTVEIYDGLEATSQNRWPSLGFDLLAVNSLFAPVFAAGFYYKTFMWPAHFWERVYEPLIRRAAGLGRASGEPDPASYETCHAFCDFLVIGGGPAGLVAALAAARAGARVVVCEMDFALGGRLLAERQEVDGRAGVDWASEVAAELGSFPNVRVLCRTAVFGVYDGRTYGAIERISDHRGQLPAFAPRQRFWKIVARRSLLATGAVERPIVFGGNDRPGVILASAARSYVNRFAVAPGRRTALFTSGDDGWKTVRDFLAAGVPIEVVVEARSTASPQDVAAARSAGLRVLCGAEVMGTVGRKRLKAIDVRDDSGAISRFAVDTLAVAGGWNPALGLSCHLGGKPRWSDAVQAFVPDALPPGMAAAGAAQGAFALADVLREGMMAGAAAASDLGFAVPPMTYPSGGADAVASSPLWWVKGSHGKAFVDLQHDVTVDDVVLAAQEGFRAAEHLKRYTTLGMATDQGKTGSLNAQAIMAELTGRPIAVDGITRARPPEVPVAIGALAGPHRGKYFRPARLPPSHDWAVAEGAVFVEAGAWRRAEYYPRSGERGWRDAVAREVTTVRTAVGVCDVSTLGKIEIVGPDAGTFLDRVYINTFSTLPIGKARYGVMLREDGFVMDDGTTARLGATRFIMSTTTAGAGKVMQHLEFCHQVLYPELDLQMTSVSDQWAQYSIAGPRSRAVLSRLADAAGDVSDGAAPHLSAVVLMVCGGISARLFRLSFSGELAYELAVPAGHGERVLRAILAAGEAEGIAPYGTGALGVMRIEKGHVAGSEINGQTTADDLGLGRMMSTKKDFIGRTLAGRPALTDPERPKFIGLRPVDRRQALMAGAHLLPLGVPATADRDEGHVTAAVYSPTLGHWIGLGLLKRGRERMGERVRALDLLRSTDIEVEVCSPVFVDPEGRRLHA